MITKRHIKLALLPLLLAFTLLATAASCDENVSAKSDETVCVFDGSNRGSQKLKYQMYPGEEPKHADSNDEIVRIPTSNRFYAVNVDRSIADAGAPQTYLGYAKGNTAVEVQGTLRFRFNVDRACEWYAKHGRRNAGDNGLGFNARNNEAASALSPWVRWLNENFGTINGQTIKAESDPFSWPELVYGDDPSMPKRNTPVDIAYGKVIGRHFSDRLTQSLGGQYFCGVDVSVWDGETIDEKCPPIYFEPGTIQTVNKDLMTNHDKLEATRANLEVEAQQATARKNRLASQLQDERTKQRLAREQARTARLELLATAAYQKCVAYAKLGFDCEGHKFPTYVIGGLPSATP